MKKLNILSLILILFLVVSCEQDILVQVPPEPPADPTGTTGSVNFTKFVSIGTSYTAGFQANALFGFGQQNSYPAIMAQHFGYVSTNDPFDQPTVNSVNGCSNPSGGCTLGRLILFDPDGPGPLTAAPAPAGAPGVPAPYNTTSSDHLQALAPYSGTKANLNNFSVPGIILAQSLIAATGGPAASNPAYNPYFARFAVTPSVDGSTGSTLIGDALATAPTFFSFWLGYNDILGYAASGGLPNGVGPQMTDAASFSGQYGAAIGSILGSNANLKGVVANIPNVTVLPFFTTIPWNTISLSSTQATDLTTLLANNYNGIVNAARNAGVITTDEERDARLLTYVEGKNGVLITDENLTDLTAFMTGAGATALIPFAKARQTKSTDRVCLTAGSYLGKDIGGGALNGVSAPLVNTTSGGTASLKGDDLILTKEELAAIAARTTEFNGSITGIVAANSTSLALVDAFTKFNELALSPVGGLVVDGLFIRATFAPPNGIFSEDGVHPNNRGSAYIAKLFIQAINDKFGSSVPLPNIALYYGTYLPVSP